MFPFQLKIAHLSLKIIHSQQFLLNLATHNQLLDLFLILVFQSTLSTNFRLLNHFKKSFLYYTIFEISQDLS